MELILCRVVESFCLPLTISFQTFLGMTFHVIRPRRDTQIFRAWYFSIAPAEILDSNMVL